MRVLFFALGGTRRRAVAEESGDVVARGGRAVVLVDQVKQWKGSFPRGVDVVDVSQLELRHLPRSIEMALLFRAPRRLFRMLGRGRLAPWTRRAGRAYERRVAVPLHRKVFMPAYHRVWRGARGRLIRRHVLRGTSFDLFVVSDPASIPDAAGILSSYLAGGVAPPGLAFGIDHARV
jgi:hypothetical protein